jgi:hypothetical protein
MASKFWYKVESFGQSSGVEVEYDGRDGKAKARRYARQMSELQPAVDFVINGYDLAETWREGKCLTN